MKKVKWGIEYDPETEIEPRMPFFGDIAYRLENCNTFGSIIWHALVVWFYCYIAVGLLTALSGS